MVFGLRECPRRVCEMGAASRVAAAETGTVLRMSTPTIEYNIPVYEMIFKPTSHITNRHLPVYHADHPPTSNET